MKKTFAIICFIVSTASFSANASHIYVSKGHKYPYQATRSTQVLGVIKESSAKSANKNAAIVAKKANDSSDKIQQTEEQKTVIEDVKKEEKTSPNSQELVTKTSSTNDKIKQFKEADLALKEAQIKEVQIKEVKEFDLDKTLKEKEGEKTQANSASEMKTQGHYITLDIIGNRGRMNEEGTRLVSGVQKAKVFSPTSSDTGGGVGLNYKYAFNFNNIFIAPGIFAERLATEINMSETTYKSYEAQFFEMNIRSRHGVFVDLGYDINSYISPYVMAGYSWVHYRARNGFGNSKTFQTAIEESMVRSGVYGAGLKINYDKNISFDIGLNTQKFKAKTSLDVPLNNVNRQRSSRYITRLDSLKVGISYKF